MTVEIKRGDTTRLQLNIKKADGSPWNLAGWAVQFGAKRNLTDSDDDAVFIKDCEVQEPASAGIATVQLTEEDTAEPGMLHAEVQLTNDTEVHTANQFDLNIVADVIRKGGPVNP